MKNAMAYKLVTGNLVSVAKENENNNRS